ncbi:MAG: FHA domain-containing protein [Actinomycetota bacterium]
MDNLPPELPDEQDPTETIDLPQPAGSVNPEDIGGAGEGYALIVASGPRRGMHWIIDDGVEAGRHPEAAIFLDDVTVSRHHAAFSMEEGTLVVRDLGSTNGTYVNGTRCDQAELAAGDEVIIGRFRLIVALDA